MRCERCGAPITENQMFCPSCGLEIIHKAPERPAQAAVTQPGMKQNYVPEQNRTQPGMKRQYDPRAEVQAQQYAPMPEPQKKKSRKGLLIGLIAGGLAVAAAAVLLFVLHPWAKEQTEEKQTAQATSVPPTPEPTEEPPQPTAEPAPTPQVYDPETEPEPEPEPEPVFISDPDSIPDEMLSEDGRYEIAFVTDAGQLKDKSYNQSTWEGCKLYAAANGHSYKYYQPANADWATDDDYYDAMKAAVDGGAKVIVCASFMQANALEKAAKEFSNVNFIFIDGWNFGLPNVAAIGFQEEQGGYLAGYATVKEGYTQLGFCGGGGGINPAVCRYGYGFLQGANAAAAEMGVQVNVKYSWQYGATFSASPELQKLASEWYASGTEVIFACGGSMYTSVVEAAEQNGGYVIGVDTDQSFESRTVITSAMKAFSASVRWALAMQDRDTGWPEIGGKFTCLGASAFAVGLPTETWSLKNWTVKEYNALFAAMRDGYITVDPNYPTDSVFSFSNVTVEVI